MERIARQPKLDAIIFDAKIEHLMSKATAVIAMGGYNTFCEILSLDKRALIVPRKPPRLEQAIRAVQAERLGLVRKLRRTRRQARPADDGARCASCRTSRCLRRCTSRACSTGSTHRSRFAELSMNRALAAAPLGGRIERRCGPAGAGGRIAVVVKGYPRLSETFIAQEILALEQRGLPLDIWSLRHPTETAIHPMHRAIRAPVRYLPEYLYQEPLRVLRGCGWASSARPSALLRLFWRDLLRDPTPNRGRRLGQALVLARELAAAIGHLTCTICTRRLPSPAMPPAHRPHLTFSAHAKDIWTTPDWEKREKIADALGA